MVCIGICDDDLSVTQYLEKLICAFFRGKSDIEVNKYDSGMELMMHDIEYDILFLDIEMEGLDGIETARLLRKRYFNIKIIFVTIHDVFFTSAFQIHAFQYLIKPLKREDILTVLRDCMDIIDMKNKENLLTIETKEKRLVINNQDIYYIEVKNRVLHISTKEGEYHKPGTLNKLYQTIKDKGYGMSHNAFIVNFYNIDTIKNYKITLKNGIILPLAQQRSISFKEQYYDYLQNVFYLL